MARPSRSLCEAGNSFAVRTVGAAPAKRARAAAAPNDSPRSPRSQGDNASKGDRMARWEPLLEQVMRADIANADENRERIARAVEENPADPPTDS